MFQYAAGRTLSLRTGLPLMLDITHLSKKSHRDYELSAFNIQARTFRRPGEGRPDLETLATMIDKGELTPVIDRTSALWSWVAR